MSAQEQLVVVAVIERWLMRATSAYESSRHTLTPRDALEHGIRIVREELERELASEQGGDAA